ncbi:MAG: hypothetical protein N2560_08255 [Ignavibacteria bacterium]|nr:hypothetical protein [Ignavibacteria bacterium]
MIALRILIILIISLFLLNFGYSQIIVTIPNENIERGRNDTITILAKFGDIPINRLNLVFQFNAYLFDVKNVVSGNEFIISDSQPNFTVQLNQLNNATISIVSSKVSIIPNVEKVLCKLVVEGLVYKDSVDTIKLVNLEIDNNPVNFTFNGGVINVRGPLVFPIKKNYLSNSFPLPTDGRVFFRFGIVNPSYVDIIVYNSKGEKVLGSQFNKNFFQVFGVKGEVSLDDKLDEGDYLLKIELPPDLAAGVYFLQLDAFSVDVFFSKFLIVK